MVDDGAHTHASTAALITEHEAELGEHETQLADHEARLAALEAGTPPDPHPPEPPQTYKPSPPLSLTRADNGAVLEWLEIANNADDSAGVSIQGVNATTRIRDITFRHCKITGFHSNFLLRWAENVVLEDCWIPMGFYCGFNVFSSNGVQILRPQVDKIWHSWPNGQGNNAYGVKIDTYSAGDAVCDTVEVSDGVFKESLYWMNLNAHSGRRISFLRNESHKAPRAIFVTGVEDSKIIGNQILDPDRDPNGTTDVAAISYGSVKGLAIDQNGIDRRYPVKIQNIDKYVSGPSSGVVIGTNPLVGPTVLTTETGGPDEAEVTEPDEAPPDLPGDHEPDPADPPLPDEDD